MRASRIVALSAVSLSLFTAAAWADETAKPAAKGKVIVVKQVDVHGFGGGCHLPAVSVSRVEPKAPLPPLTKPVADIAAATERDPF